MGPCDRGAPLLLSNSRQPDTAAALLRMLGIQDVPVGRQKFVLRAWLAANIPTPALRISLRRNGYGVLLDERYGRAPIRWVG
jgi:hypothetical protein